MEEIDEKLKSLLMRVKEESEKAELKLIIQKTKIMASSPITSWQVGGETMKTVTDFIFLDSKITEDGGCIHEIKRHLLLGSKAITSLDSVLKNRDITLPQFSSVQSLSRVWLFATPWIAARQASLSITNSWSSLKLTSI